MDLAIFIQCFIHPRKKFRENYPNCPKSHWFENLVLIEEEENLMKKSIVSNVYTMYHADFGGVGSYSARKYVCMTE